MKFISYIYIILGVISTKSTWNETIQNNEWFYQLCLATKKEQPANKIHALV